MSASEARAALRERRRWFTTAGVAAVAVYLLVPALLGGSDEGGSAGVLLALGLAMSAGGVALARALITPARVANMPAAASLPEAGRALSLLGAALFLVPAAWGLVVASVSGQAWHAWLFVPFTVATALAGWRGVGASIAALAGSPAPEPPVDYDA